MGKSTSGIIALALGALRVTRFNVKSRYGKDSSKNGLRVTNKE